jgi:hypothetical protein
MAGKVMTHPTLHAPAHRPTVEEPMTDPHQVAVHLSEARNQRFRRPELAEQYRELAEDEMAALMPQVHMPLEIDLAIDETCATLETKEEPN